MGLRHYGMVTIIPTLEIQYNVLKHSLGNQGLHKGRKSECEKGWIGEYVCAPMVCAVSKLWCTKGKQDRMRIWSERGMRSRAVLQRGKKKVWFPLIYWWINLFFFTLEKVGKRRYIKKELCNCRSPRKNLFDKETQDEGMDVQVNVASQKQEHMPGQVSQPF